MEKRGKGKIFTVLGGGYNFFLKGVGQKYPILAVGLYRISGWPDIRPFLISGIRPDIRFHLPDIRPDIRLAG